MCFVQFQSKETEIDEHQTFHTCSRARIRHLSEKVRLGSSIFDTGMAENLQPVAVRVVHQEQRDAVIHREIASTKQLSIPLIVGERQGCRIHDP